uniref:ubiquitinyl hydrolase 1 n=1 Tax=Timema monikensis TaxID=170555 RepID=A0A7R9EIG0_9NEOP|nr:unnamed protein product [Timema monikensis]
MLKIPTYLCMKKCVTPEVTCPLSLICDGTEEVGTLQEAIEQRTEENVDLSYRIIGAVTHDGISHNSGHYMADVYNTEQQGWYHCDDENVFKSTEEEVLGHDQQHNGYLFFYIYSCKLRQEEKRNFKSQLSQIRDNHIMKPNVLDPCSKKKPNVLYPCSKKKPNVLYPCSKKKPNVLYPCSKKKPNVLYPCSKKKPNVLDPCSKKKPNVLNPCSKKKPNVLNPCSKKKPNVLDPCSKKKKLKTIFVE